MLYYGLSPTEVLLVMVRYRESVLKQFMDKEGQFSRQIEDAWLENKITALPKPEGEGEAQEIARQMVSPQAAPHHYRCCHLRHCHFLFWLLWVMNRKLFNRYNATWSLKLLECVIFASMPPIHSIFT
jgi:translation elongation factor EF-G